MNSRLVLLALLMLELLPACVRTAPRPKRTPRPPTPTASPRATPSPTPAPKRLTICMQDEPDSLYLYGAKSEAAGHLWQAIYDGPVDLLDYERYPVILTDVPKLAKTARVETVVVKEGDRVLSTGGSVMGLAPGVMVEDAQGTVTAFQGEALEMERMVVTFTLRADVRWSDGEPLDADDSVYSFELAADAATPTDKQIVKRTADYRAVGDHQVAWVGVPGFLDRGYAENFWHPLPKHAWQGLSAEELLTAEVSARRPLGWGPFKIGAWVAGDSMILERNPLYFRSAEGLPRVDELTFRFIADAEELGRHLRAGTCDVVTHEAAAELDVEALRRAPGVRAVMSADDAWELLAFGISSSEEYERPDFFEDVRVRQGLAQCVDRQWVADAALGGEGQVSNSLVPTGHPAHTGEGVRAWPYDPGAGGALLAQAGWYDEDGDGVREAHAVPEIAEGTPFRLTLLTTEGAVRQATATLVAQDLGACGIKVTVEVMKKEMLFAPGPEGVLFGRRFDLAQFAWPVRVEPLCDLFVSSQFPGSGDWGKPNVVGFIDDSYDQACREALDTLPGSADYAAKQAEPQRIFAERLPALPLFVRQRTTLARERVVGLAPNPSEMSELWNLERIDLER